MKLHHSILVILTLLVLPACEKKSTSDKVKDGINDALDRRPGEKVRDAAEDAKDAVKEAGKDVKDAVNEATK